MVEVFKTNVQEVEQSMILIEQLLEHFPTNNINFDLEDCDRILRVEGSSISKEKIIQCLTSNGFQCELL